MDTLFKDLDQNDAEDLEEANKMVQSNEQIINDQGQVAFSKQEEMQFQAEKGYKEPATQGASAADKRSSTSGMQTAAANPFSKKRTVDQMTKNEPSKQPATQTQTQSQSDFSYGN